MENLQTVFGNKSGVAATIRKSEINKVHFVKYQWDKNFENIILQYYDRELMQTFSWVPENINIAFTTPRKCIGFYVGDKYFPCIIHSYVDDFPQCFKCVSHSIPRPNCIFEPECKGNKCPRAICGEPHNVYLAFYNTRCKIGMSSARRLKLRLFEQGADAYVIVAQLDNRLSARKLEKNLSRILGIRQAYEPEEILKTFTQKLKKQSVEEKFELVSKSLKNGFKLECSNLVFIENHPLETPLRSMPVLRSTKGLHKGKLVGLKGKFLIYDSAGLNAIKMDEALGHYITFQTG